ncbi:MAG: thiamine phosphate synthase [Paludibacteraceae bacterium]|nr:thiamine phosphate synthase [Paludibacteraceae bacterium]
MKKEDVQLCLVTDSEMCHGRDLAAIVAAAVKGGCTMVQLREKKADTRTFLSRAYEIKEVLKGTHVPLIINDRIDIALAADADGVHLGQSDMPVEVARKLLGKDKIIGWSVETMEDIEKANQMDIDYIGISPVFATSTKTDTAHPFGITGTRQAAAMSIHPTIGIGGIHRENAREVMECGIDGIAVVSEIMLAADPEQAAKELNKIINNNLPQTTQTTQTFFI